MKLFLKIFVILIVVYIGLIFFFKITKICPDAYGAGSGYGGKDILFKLKLCPFSELLTD